MRRDSRKSAGRKEQTDKSKSQRDSQIKVITNWQHTQEHNPTFRRLMMLLLKPKDNQPGKTVQTNEEHQNEQC